MKIITERNGWPIEEMLTKSRGWPVEISVPAFENKDVEVHLALEVSDSSGKLLVQPKIVGPDTIVLTDFDGQEQAFRLKVARDIKFTTKGIMLYRNEAEIIPLSVKAEIVDDNQAVEIYEMDIGNY
jgi:hypothetical protein